MDIQKLYEILNETTAQYRKGPERVDTKTAGVNVTEFYMMPPTSDIADDIVKVDLSFITIGVDKKKAEARKAELIGILNHYPEPKELADGPSYITVGARIGDQGAAFQLFALGEVLGLWKVITPEFFGITGSAAREAAGNGYIMISGYKS
jgi:hypothetical protein